MSFFIAGTHRQRLDDRKTIVLEDIRHFLSAIRDVAFAQGDASMRSTIIQSLGPAAELVRDMPSHYEEYLVEGSRVLGSLVRTLADMNRQLRAVLDRVVALLPQDDDSEAAAAQYIELMANVSRSLGGFVQLLKEVEEDVREETKRNLEAAAGIGSSVSEAGRQRSKSTEIGPAGNISNDRPVSVSWTRASVEKKAPETAPASRVGRNTMIVPSSTDNSRTRSLLGSSRIVSQAIPAVDVEQESQMDALLHALRHEVPGDVPGGVPADGASGSLTSNALRPVSESSAKSIPVLPPKRSLSAAVITTPRSQSAAPAAADYTLQIDTDGSLVAGTVDRLIDQLVIPNSVDGKYRFQFFFCYRDFLTPTMLLEHLKRRFSEPSIVHGGEAAEAEKNVQIVRVKTLAVVRYWIDTYWPDFVENNNSLLNSLQVWIADTVMAVMDQGGRQLVSTVAKKQEEGAERSSDKLAGAGLLRGAERPAPLLTKRDGGIISPHTEWRFRDIPALEVARQLTLMEFELFRRIHPWELSGQAWAKDAKNAAAAQSRVDKRKSLRPATLQKAKNVTAMIDAFNQVSDWVKNEILGEPTARGRADAISHFISVGKKCHKDLQSYNTAMEIIASLNHSSITRLKQTWPHVSAKRKAELESMSQLMSGNFAALREQVAEASFRPPLLPYLGVYLSDLTMIDENADTLDPPPGAPKDVVLVNFYKYRKMAVIFEEISGCQLTPYNVEPVPFIQEYVRKVYVVHDEKELYDMSLRIEPRVAADEPQVDSRSISERARDMSFNARSKSFSALRNTLRSGNKK